MQNITKICKEIYKKDAQGYTAYIKVSELFNVEENLIYPSDDIYPSPSIFPIGENNIISDGQNYFIEHIEEDIAEIAVNFITQKKLIGNIGYKVLKFKLYNASKYNLINKKLTLYIKMFDEDGNISEYKIGEFKVIDSPSRNLKENEIEVEAQDFTYLFLKKLDLKVRMQFPAKIEDIIEVLRISIGMEIVTTGIANLNYIVKKPPYYKDNLIKELIKYLAEATASNVFLDNKNRLIFKPIDKKNGTILFDEGDILDFQKSEISIEKYDRIKAARIDSLESNQFDVVSFPNNVQGENLNDHYIYNNGIIDEDRETALKEIYTKLKNLSYIGGELELKLAPFLEPFDFIRLNSENKNDYFYIMDCLQDITSGSTKTNLKIESNLEKEHKPTTLRERINNAEIFVDKLNGKIRAYIENATDHTQEISELFLDLNNIKLWKEAVFDLKKEMLSEENTIRIYDASDEKMLEFKANGIVPFEDTAIYPSSGLYPSSDTYAKRIDVFNLNIPNIRLQQLNDIETLRDIDFKERQLLSVDGQQETLIIKRNGEYEITRFVTKTKDGGYKKEKSIHKGKIEPIVLQDGYNKFIFSPGEANCVMSYVFQNDFKDTTKALINNQLEINNEHIQLKLDEKTDNVEFLNQLKLTKDSFNSSLSKKVGKSEVISSINQSPEDIKLKADKIKFEGLVTANDNFLIKEDGSIETNNAKINGDLILDKGVYTSFSFTGQKGKGVLVKNNNFNPVGYDYDGIINKWIPQAVKIDYLMPDNFTIDKVILSIIHIPRWTSAPRDYNNTEQPTYIDFWTWGQNLGISQVGYNRNFYERYVSYSEVVYGEDFGNKIEEIGSFTKPNGSPDGTGYITERRSFNLTEKGFWDQKSGAIYIRPNNTSEIPHVGNWGDQNWLMKQTGNIISILTFYGWINNK